jgi:hypothetical protein
LSDSERFDKEFIAAYALGHATGEGSGDSGHDEDGRGASISRGVNLLREAEAVIIAQDRVDYDEVVFLSRDLAQCCGRVGGDIVIHSRLSERQR